MTWQHFNSDPHSALPRPSSWMATWMRLSQASNATPLTAGPTRCLQRLNRRRIDVNLKMSLNVFVPAASGRERSTA